MTRRNSISYDNFDYQARILDKDLSTPPGSPVAGNRYIIGGSPTGDWSGKTNYVTYYLGSAWVMVVPFKGMFVFVADEDKYYWYTGTEWSIYSSISAGSKTISFTDANLSSGKLSFSHNLNVEYPGIAVYDNNDQLMAPDDVTPQSVNSVEIDLTSLGTITGTWHVTAIGGSLELDYTNSYRDDFVEADLTSSKITITHSLNIEKPHITVFNSSGQEMIPTQKKSVDFNNVELDFTGLTPLTGTYSVRISGGVMSDFTWKVKTSDYTALVEEGVLVDTSSSAITITLPATASVGDKVRVTDGKDNAATNNITVARNGHNINGNAGNFIIDVDGAATTLVYMDSTEGWRLING